MRVGVFAAAGDTINIDGAMLIQNDRALNYFEVNTNDGASGVESADDAPELAIPWFGFDVRNIDYLHKWRRLDKGSDVWSEILSLGLAINAREYGFDKNGTFRARAYLEDGYTDDVITEVISDTDVRRGWSVSPSGFTANKIVGHADLIKKSGGLQTIWMASACDVFDEREDSPLINESIADDARWPNPDDYPEFWARIGAVNDRDFSGEGRTSTLPNLGQTGGATQWAFHYGDRPQPVRPGSTTEGDVASTIPAYTRRHPALDHFGWREPAGNNREIIGAADVDIIHKAFDTGDGQSALDEVTEGTVVDGVDATSRANEVRILLENTTGGTVSMSDCGLLGKPVFRLSDAAGYTHDSFIDWEDIAENGEQLFEFGNRDVIDKDQLTAMADYFWKVARGKKHTYSFALDGLQHWLYPGCRALLQVGSAGKAEYVDSVVEIRSLKYVYQKGAAAVTMVTAAECEENWKQTSSALARVVASGDVRAYPSNGRFRSIASDHYIGPTDTRIEVGNTSAQTQINAAIDEMAGVYGGGVVQLTKGTFVVDGPILLKENVTLQGEGAQTIIEKNCNDYAIEGAGGSGTEIAGITVRNLKVTRDASDTNNIPLVYFAYCDDLHLSNIASVNSKYDSISLAYCDDFIIDGCRAVTTETAPGGTGSIVASLCTRGTIANCNAKDGPDAGFVINSSTYITMTGCVGEGSFYNLSMNAAQYCTISGNTFNTAASTGAGIGGTDIEKCSIADNTCIGNTGNGISLGGDSDDNVISGNVATGNGVRGIHIIAGTCDRNVVTGNRATGNTTANFTDSGTNTTDTGNDWN